VVQVAPDLGVLEQRRPPAGLLRDQRLSAGSTTKVCMSTTRGTSEGSAKIGPGSVEKLKMIHCRTV
jgi:hypothetical protein